MSSLAKQLKQLQIPQNLVGPATKKQAHKASLLFDGREAADIDNETIFSLASNGLEELKTIEPAFGSFQETLFSELSKKMERSLQTKEFNERLNKQISEFLRYLSPYFLLKPAHKALEWLIRRYRIHISNEDELVSCILPYHETNLFVRVVQLLMVRNPASNYHWLEPLQKSGTPLAKTTLLNKCTTDMAFLNGICEMVPKALELDRSASSLRVVLTFYASTVVGTLEMMRRITEEIITLLLPYIVTGLKSPVSEYLSASYMIIAQLCNKCTLEEKLVKSLLECICKHLKEELAMEGLMCLTIICSSQAKQRFPKKAFKNLMSLDSITNHICQLSNKCDITALLQILLPQLAATVIKECLPDKDSPKDSRFADCLYNLAKQLEMEKSLVKLFARSVLIEYCKARNDMSDDPTHVKKLNKCLKLLAQFLEKRYPIELETALEEYLDGLKSSLEGESEETVHQYSQWTLDFMSLALSGCKSKIIPDSSASLMLSLHHPKSDVRHLAIKHLHDLIISDKVSQDDEEFISGALLARLSDEDLSVVDGVLNMDKVLLKFLPHDQLVEKLLGILDAGEWNEHCDKAVSLLSCSEMVDDNPMLVDRVVYGLLPLLFVSQKNHKQTVVLAKKLSQTGLTDAHYMLKHMKRFVKKKEWKSCETSTDPDVLAAGNRVLFSWLGENLASVPVKDLLDKVIVLSRYCTDHSSNNMLTIMVNCILGKLITMTTVTEQPDVLEVVLQLILGSLEGVDKQKESKNTAKDGESESKQECVSLEGIVPSQLISVLVTCMVKKKKKRTEAAKSSINLWLLGNFIRSLKVNSMTFKGVWWNSEKSVDSTRYTKVLLLLFNVLVHGSCVGKPTGHQATFKQLLQELIQCHLSSKTDLIKFLGYIWSCPVSKQLIVDTDALCSPVLLRVHSLHVGSVCLASLDKQEFKKIAGHSSTAVTSLLVPLCNPISAIRKGAVLCLKSLRSSFTLLPPVDTFVDLLVESGEELEADHEHLHRLLTLAFSCLSLSPAKNSQTKSRKSEEEMVLAGMLEYVVGHTVRKETPIYVQKTLLTVMSGVVTQPLFESCIPALEKLISKSRTTGLSKDENTCLSLLIQKFSPVTADMLESEPRVWHIMKTILDLRVSVCPGHPPPIVILLTQINNTFFQAIPSKTIQQEILSTLLDILLHTKNDIINNKVKDTVSQMRLSAEHMVEELRKLKTEKELKTPKKKKVKKSPVVEDLQSVEAASWQRVIIILELLQHLAVTDEQLILPALFSILARCVEMDTSSPVNYDYIMQLLLGQILSICQRVGKDGKHDKKDINLPEDKFNVELIVQCIRVSDNPQTHHHALLLLAAAANLFPEKVLHNVMSIFTFMGANVMRQDDSYSFLVISKTVDKVIPALIQAGERQQLPKLDSKGSPAVSLDDIVAMVIRVFADASPHVPEHRRLPVFSHLVSTVGAPRFLHVTLVLLLEKYVIHSPETEEEEDGTVHSPLDLDFCLSLCQEFEPEIQAEGVLKLLQYLTKLPAEKTDVPHRTRGNRRSTALFSTSSPLFDVQAHSAKHLRQFKFVAMGFISTVLSSDGFVSKLQEQESHVKDSLQNIYLSLIEEVLTYVTTTSQYTEGQTQGTAGKFWRALLHRTYDIIDKVNQLLPPGVFVGVIRQLLGNSNSTVRRKAMELLNTKLGQRTIHQQTQVDEFLQLVGDLLSLVKMCDNSETPVNRQTALYSLKLLARALGEQQPAIFTKVLETCIEVFTNKNENSQVSSNALLCLGEVCTALKANAITYLPRFMPRLLELLQTTGQDRNVLMLLCSVVTLHKVTETLPNFLSPYLVSVLQRVTCPSLNTLNNSEKDEKKSSLEVQLQDNLIALRKDIAQVIIPRVLIPAVSMCYDSICNTSHMSVPLLMSILHEAITCMDKRDVTSHQEQLFKFFLVVLDFRVVQPQCEPDILEDIESIVTSTFCGLVIKMSEATFRPMFLKLVDWATRGNADRDRLLVFYRLCDSLADKLKKLMTLFAGYIIKNCALLLDANNIAKTEEPFYVVQGVQDKQVSSDHDKSCLLINNIMDCLHKCLLHSTRGFMDKERFNCLMQPLVDQLENQMGSTSEFQERITNHVVPCLAQLAVAAGSDAEWKPLNYQVLLKTRHSSPQVRFAALKALEEFYRQLGEEFVVHLLPESLPFLAELMEDECPEVEEQCQHVAQQIESIIGEPLQKYLES